MVSESLEHIVRVALSREASYHQASMQKRRSCRVLLTAFSALVCLSALSSGCDGQADAANSTSSTDEPALPVELYQVAEETFNERVTLSANILPKRQVKIVPRVPGRIAEILAEAGDRVEEGQIVARLEQRDYLLGVKQARAQLAAARANAALARVGRSSAATIQKRMESLHESKAISGSELEKVVDGHKMGIARASAAEAQEQLALVGLEAARTKLADTVLRAPFAGRVVKRLLDEGDLCGVMPPGVIMLIADDSQMKAIGDVSELQLRRIRHEMPASVHVDALPAESISGTVDLVSPMVDPATRTASVQILIPNDGRLEMGMSAEIELDLGSRSSPAIPDDCLTRGSDRSTATVYVVVDDRVRRRNIRLGGRQGALVEVVEGLRVGERVVRGQHSSLRDGQRVTVSSPESS